MTPDEVKERYTERFGKEPFGDFYREDNDTHVLRWDVGQNHVMVLITVLDGYYEEYWIPAGKEFQFANLHRLDGPACVHYDEQGELEHIYWYRDGQSSNVLECLEHVKDPKKKKALIEKYL